jgi:hypothetical protein
MEVAHVPAKKKESITQVLRRYFTVALILVAALGALGLFLGLFFNVPFVAALGTAIFSAATVGAIFKVIGYDVYLSFILRETLISREFLSMLSFKELKAVVKETIVSMKGTEPSAKLYQAFEECFVSRLLGVWTKNREYTITLSQVRKYSARLVEANVVISYEAVNDTNEPKALFPFNDMITSVDTTIPRAIVSSRIPQNANEICDLLEFSIEGSPVRPPTMIEFLDVNDKTKGVKLEATLRKDIDPSGTKLVRYVTRSINDEADWIMRRFTTYTDRVSLTIQHPESLEVIVVWFISPEHAKLNEPVVQNQIYKRNAEGTLFPMNGFVVVWRPKRPSARPQNE